MLIKNLGKKLLNMFRLRCHKNKYMTLIGHLQVLDVPLVSLYYDKDTDKHYLAISLLEKEIDNSYLFAEILPINVYNYISRKISLVTIILNCDKVYYYVSSGKKDLCFAHLKEVFTNEALITFNENFGGDEMFNHHLSYKTYGMKEYLISKC